jgi:plasmid stabilization system protein ParE
MMVVITEPAAIDLRDIGDYLMLESRARAIKVVTDLREACADLANALSSISRIGQRCTSSRALTIFDFLSRGHDRPSSSHPA